MWTCRYQCFGEAYCLHLQDGNCSCETAVSTYKSTMWCHNPEDQHWNPHHCRISNLITAHLTKFQLWQETFRIWQWKQNQNLFGNADTYIPNRCFFVLLLSILDTFGCHKMCMNNWRVKMSRKCWGQCFDQREKV